MRKVAEFYKALADETRLKMLWLLMNYKELCVCDFIEVLESSQSKASRHLRNLYHAGLVNDRQEGLWVFYSLKTKDELPNSDNIKELKKTIAATKDAQMLIDKMDDWLKRKNDGETCKVAAK